MVRNVEHIRRFFSFDIMVIWLNFISGSGLSKYTGQEQTVETIAKDVVALISQLCLDLKSTVLIGHSMGGMIACELGSLQTYAAIVLIGPVNPTPAVAEVFVARIQTVQERKWYTVC
jgi:pimeloyl-ACP methyl ester carboxylesterase